MRSLSQPIVLTQSLARRKRVVAGAGVLTPIVGALFAVYLLVDRGITIGALIAFFLMYLISMLGITLGYHRFASHRGFAGRPFVLFTLLAMGSMAGQGSVVHWVSHHRKHHETTDTPDDVHSPVSSDGLWTGFWHAHLGWMFGTTVPNPIHYGRDLYRDELILLADRLYWWFFLAGLIVPSVLVATIYGTWYALLEGFLWGGLARVFAVQHATWSVNSFAHLVGYRNYSTTDNSRNCAALSLITLGEGLHNNHHFRPGSPNFAAKTNEFDIGFQTLVLLTRAGLVSIKNRGVPTA